MQRMGSFLATHLRSNTRVPSEHVVLVLLDLLLLLDEGYGFFTLDSASRSSIGIAMMLRLNGIRSLETEVSNRQLRDHREHYGSYFGHKRQRLKP